MEPKSSQNAIITGERPRQLSPDSERTRSSPAKQRTKADASKATVAKGLHGKVETGFQDNPSMDSAYDKLLKKKKPFLSVPDHPTFWDVGENGLERKPRHKLPLGCPSCRWMPYHKKYGIPKALLSFGKKMLMTTDDNHPTRVFAILNEVAESLKESLENRFPAIAKPVYLGLWSLTAAYLGVRNTVASLDDHSATKGLKMFTQDFVAAVSMPTLVVRGVCYVINKLLESVKLKESWLGDTVRPLVAYFTASATLHKLDPIVKTIIKKISPYTFDIIEPHIDSFAKKAFKAVTSMFFKPPANLYSANGFSKR